MQACADNADPKDRRPVPPAPPFQTTAEFVAVDMTFLPLALVVRTTLIIVGCQDRCGTTLQPGQRPPLTWNRGSGASTARVARTSVVLTYARVAFRDQCGEPQQQCSLDSNLQLFCNVLWSYRSCWYFMPLAATDYPTTRPTVRYVRACSWQGRPSSGRWHRCR